MLTPMAQKTPLANPMTSRAVSTSGEILHVAGVMAFWIVQTVLLAIRIEVASGGLEVGTVALRVLMNMDGVLSRRQILQ